MNDIKIAPIPIPPGNTILDQINFMRLTKKEFARRLHVSITFLDALLEGKMPLDNVVACDLERVIGLPAQFWIGLEKTYREVLGEQNMFVIWCKCGYVIESNDLSIWCPDCGANYNIVINSCLSKQKKVKE